MHFHIGHYKMANYIKGIRLETARMLLVENVVFQQIHLYTIIMCHIEFIQPRLDIHIKFNYVYIFYFRIIIIIISINIILFINNKAYTSADLKDQAKYPGKNWFMTFTPMQRDQGICAYYKLFIEITLKR